MIDPIVLLAQVSDSGPDGYEKVLGGGFLALSAVLGWVIGLIKGQEKYQGLASKLDTLASGYQSIRGSSIDDLAVGSAMKAIELSGKVKGGNE